MATLPSRGELRACPRCGRQTMRPIDGPGRLLRYRNAVLTLPDTLRVPTCHRCKHVELSFEAIPDLAARLEATYRADLCQRAAVAITRLQRTCSQRRLERAMDLSYGYLSRLRAGDGVPSAALVSLLALLAAAPERLLELDRYWSLSEEAVDVPSDGTSAP